jgi:flagellum-specific peptidoglycan hydrolase FlgJ
LVKSGEKDYRVWVRALVEAGYSDDLEYGKKTMALIRVLNLTELDHH